MSSTGSWPETRSVPNRSWIAFTRQPRRRAGRTARSWVAVALLVASAARYGRRPLLRVDQTRVERKRTMSERARVVVGVDGSAESLAALTSAMEQAARRGTGVRVVSAFWPPQYWPNAYGLSAPPTIEQVKADLRTIASRMVEQLVAAQHALASVPVELHEVSGSPAR